MIKLRAFSFFLVCQELFSFKFKLFLKTLECLLNYTGVGSLSLLQVLPNPEIELRSPTLQVDSLPAEPQGKPSDIGMGSLSLLQGIFPTQELNQGLLHCSWILYQLSYQGSPIYTYIHIYVCVCVCVCVYIYIYISAYFEKIMELESFFPPFYYVRIVHLINIVHIATSYSWNKLWSHILYVGLNLPIFYLDFFYTMLTSESSL